MIARERGGAGSIGSEDSRGATHKNQKRREVLKYTVLTKDEKPDEDSHKE